MIKIYKRSEISTEEILERSEQTIDVEGIVTDIIKNGSYVIYNTKGKNIMDIAYQTDVSEGYFVDGCVSRKKHVVPTIMSILEN